MQLSLNRKASQNDLIHSFVVTVSEPIRYSLQFKNALIIDRFWCNGMSEISHSKQNYDCLTSSTGQKTYKYEPEIRNHNVVYIDPLMRLHILPATDYRI